MTGKCFVDSNIWIYSFADDDPARKKKACEFLDNTQSKVVSWQVVNETCSTLLHKKGKDEIFIRFVVDHICESYEVVDFSASLLEAASRLRARHSISFWDSLIVAAALAAECSTLASEDMQHGQKYGGMTIRNIFA